MIRAILATVVVLTGVSAFAQSGQGDGPWGQGSYGSSSVPATMTCPRGTEVRAIYNFETRTMEEGCVAKTWNEPGAFEVGTPAYQGVPVGAEGAPQFSTFNPAAPAEAN